MTPEQYETAKQAAGILATMVVVGAAAWKARGRRDRAVPTYSGPPDDHPRKITRKEWHDRGDVLEEHGRKLAVLRHHDRARQREVGELRGEFRAFSAVATSAATSLARLEERFMAHVERWEAGSEDARREREEMRAEMRNGFASLERKITGG